MLQSFVCLIPSCQTQLGLDVRAHDTHRQVVGTHCQTLELQRHLRAESRECDEPENQAERQKQAGGCGVADASLPSGETQSGKRSG